MEQYIYTYLNQKYGLKNLIIEWFVAIINGIQAHQNEDHDVRLFGKILKNECDEEFRFIQMHVKDTLLNLLRVLLRDKYQFKGEAEIGRMLEQIQSMSPVALLGRGDVLGLSKGQAQSNNLQAKESGAQTGVIDEWMWRRIIEKMYDQADAIELEQRFHQQMNKREEALTQHLSAMSDQQLIQYLNQSKLNISANRKVSRDDILQIVRKNQGKLLYQDFQKTILDFQL